MPHSILPIIAIVGEPNAGKSTLLNKIAGAPLAITSTVAGTTRDRQYADASWSGVDFTLVDTAGLSMDLDEGLEENVNRQIEIALDEADVILWVADGKQPAGAVPRHLIQKFRKIKKPLLLAVNKLDSPKTRETAAAAFRKLGIKKLYPVSALSGLGIGDLLDALTEELKALGKHEPAPQKTAGIAVSIAGKPNVGKSSLFNAILKEERVVVSPIPGTTRAAIDSQMEIDGENYTFIDTAGLKKKAFRQSQPDVFAGFQTFKAIRRSDVCLFVLDANEEITKQDQRVASEIAALEKGCIILVNKIDAYTQDNLGKSGGKWDSRRATDDRYGTLRDYVSHHFPFLWMCPAFFVSARTGEGLDEALAAIKPIFQARNKTIDAQVLSEFLRKKLKTNPPKLLRDQKKPKVFSLRQLDANPPLFELVVNHPAAISMQFRKALQNAIIKELDFWGTPITLKLKGKDKS